MTDINADVDLTMDISLTEASVHFCLYHYNDKDGVIDDNEWPVIDETIIDNGIDTSDLLTWDTAFL